jgi:hypothetical protein
MYVIVVEKNPKIQNPIKKLKPNNKNYKAKHTHTQIVDFLCHVTTLSWALLESSPPRLCLTWVLNSSNAHSLGCA